MPLKIIVDTREQRPYTFEGYDAVVLHRKLDSGDYSVPGLESNMAIERKSLNDIVGSLTRGRARFLRECERLSTYDFAAIIVEADLPTMGRPYPFSKAAPEGIIGSLQFIALRYGIHVIYASSRALGEKYAYGLLEKADRYAAKAAEQGDCDVSDGDAAG